MAPTEGGVQTEGKLVRLRFLQTVNNYQSKESFHGLLLSIYVASPHLLNCLHCVPSFRPVTHHPSCSLFSHWPDAIYHHPFPSNIKRCLMAASSWPQPVLSSTWPDSYILGWGHSYQGEIVRVDPDDAEVGVISVLTCHLLQDFQEFITIYWRVQRSCTVVPAYYEVFAWDVLVIMLLLWLEKSTKVVMYLGHLPRQRQQYALRLCHPPVCATKWQERLIATINITCYWHFLLITAIFQVSYPDLIHAVRLQLPQSRPETSMLNVTQEGFKEHREG